MKWLGAVLVIAGCGGWGLMMAANDRKEERLLRQLVRALEWLASELACRMWPLPVLFREAAQQTEGMISVIFRDFAAELDRQAAPDACGCMESVLSKHPSLPEKCAMLLSELGGCLGRFDLEGQLREIVNAEHQARVVLERHCDGRDQRLRCYRTLGICAGFALALMLL